MERSYRGGIRILADGTAVVDLVNANAKHVIRFAWENISNTDWGTLKTAFAHVDDSSASLTAPDGNVYTVTRDPSSPGLTGTSRVAAGGNLIWDAQMTLREV
jgi:hypothetical protein